jgi:hypothetical protein
MELQQLAPGVQAEQPPQEVEQEAPTLQPQQAQVPRRRLPRRPLIA